MTALHSCLHCAWPLQKDDCQSIPADITFVLCTRPSVKAVRWTWVVGGAGIPFSRILEAAVLSPALRARAQQAVLNLLRAFGCTMLQQGLFQADPHAGNLLLQVQWRAPQSEYNVIASAVLFPAVNPTLHMRLSLSTAPDWCTLLPSASSE